MFKFSVLRVCASRISCTVRYISSRNLLTDRDLWAEFLQFITFVEVTAVLSTVMVWVERKSASSPLSCTSGSSDALNYENGRSSPRLSSRSPLHPDRSSPRLSSRSPLLSSNSSVLYENGSSSPLSLTSRSSSPRLNYKNGSRSPLNYTNGSSKAVWSPCKRLSGTGTGGSRTHIKTVHWVSEISEAVRSG